MVRVILRGEQVDISFHDRPLHVGGVDADSVASTVWWRFICYQFPRLFWTEHFHVGISIGVLFAFSINTLKIYPLDVEMVGVVVRWVVVDWTFPTVGYFCPKRLLVLKGFVFFNVPVPLVNYPYHRLPTPRTLE